MKRMNFFLNLNTNFLDAKETLTTETFTRISTTGLQARTIAGPWQNRNPLSEQL